MIGILGAPLDGVRSARPLGVRKGSAGCYVLMRRRDRVRGRERSREFIEMSVKERDECVYWVAERGRGEERRMGWSRERE